MMLTLPDALDAALLGQMRGMLDEAQWHDGRETAGPIAEQRKRNEQLRVNDKHAVELGRHILQALSRNPRFISFALPARMLSPMFNRYQGGGTYGFHIDNALRVDPLSGERIRTDLSITVFLNEPDEYEGGELIVQDTYGEHGVKLPAGHVVVYPGTSLHRVQPVTRGQRLASFFWIQSLVRDDAQRALLFELDNNIQRLGTRPENAEEVLRLSGVYHNLIRFWAQA